jgi:signal transduction histidine kinase
VHEVAKARATVLDALIAAGSFVYGQAEVWNAGSADHVMGPRWAVSLSVGVASLLLLLRRRRPVGVLIAQCVVVTVPALIYGSSELIGFVLPLLIGEYSVAAFAPARRQRIIGAVAVIFVLIVNTLRDPVLNDWGQVLGAAAFWIVFPLAWVLGDYARTRRLYITALGEQAVRAERDRADQAHREVAHERARIARELHDVVAHGLTVVVRQAEAGDVRLDTDPAGARASFAAIAEAARQSLVEMRRLVTILRVDEPSADASKGPQLGSFEVLLQGVRSAGIEVVARHDDLSDLPIGLQLTSYRLVQEALTNTMQHASATRVDVSVRRESDALLTEVVDNGTAPTSTRRGGMGLIGLRERVTLFDGEFKAGARDGGGFAVTARIPLRREPGS